MTVLAGIGVLAIFIAVPFIGAGAAIYNAYWASKIWMVLVVPATGWPRIPLAAFVGIALIVSALRPSDSKKDEGDGAWERLGKSVAITLVASPLAYLVARIAASWLL